MRYLLFILGGISALIGYFVWHEANAVTHQMLAAQLYVCAAVLVSGSGIVSAIEAIPERQHRFQRRIDEQAAHDAKAAAAKAARDAATQPPQGQPPGGGWERVQ